jgi:hypothetical protein
MNATNEPAARCPVCGGPAREVQVFEPFWRGAVEPVTIVACNDATCDAYVPVDREGGD